MMRNHLTRIAAFPGNRKPVDHVTLRNVSLTSAERLNAPMPSYCRMVGERGATKEERYYNWLCSRTPSMCEPQHG
jgi:hypothetical protein